MRRPFLFSASSLESHLTNYTDRPVLADGTAGAGGILEMSMPFSLQYRSTIGYH